ncbi:MAG: amidohydrolase family protein [Candidatus Omnitrophica bacterium]|nr:amidohydrolase family protein [Candidatus Omnitrophota bacterium]
MIIDIHTHAWPDKVSGKARENLESHYTVTLVGDPTVKTLLSYMDKNRIDYSCICAVASRPEQVVSINNWLFSIDDPRLKVFAALHPAFGGWKEEIKRIRDKTFGIKLQPSFQEFYVDDEAVFPLYEELQKQGLYVLFHSGDELAPELVVRATPQRLRKVRDRFPGLTMIAAHFGGFRFWEDVKKYLLGRDIYFDTSAFFGYVPDKEAKELILGHRADRILFGTDFPIINQKKDLDYLDKLGLDKGLKEMILSANARRLLKIP